MDAQTIVNNIGKGIECALRTKEIFLGIERFQFENADVHPEYMMTVKVAESFIDPDTVVAIEAHMKMLRLHAIGLNNLYRGKYKAQQNIVRAKLESSKFEAMDGRRLDILVGPSDNHYPPHLVAEAKLGIGNISGVLEDINRILLLLDMYNELGINNCNTTYGAVVFHIMREGDKADNLSAEANDFLKEIDNHLNTKSSEFQWLQHQSGLLHASKIYRDVSGYEEHYEDGYREEIFAKEKFSLAPGLVFLGSTPDVSCVNF